MSASDPTLNPPDSDPYLRELDFVDLDATGEQLDEEVAEASVYVTIKKFEKDQCEDRYYAIVENPKPNIGRATRIKWILRRSRLLPKAKLVYAKEERGGNVKNTVYVSGRGSFIAQEISVYTQDGKGELEYNLKYSKDGGPRLCEVMAIEPNVCPQCVNHRNEVEDGGVKILAPSPPPRLIVP